MTNKRTFVLIGLLVFVLDALFIVANYYSSKETLYQSLLGAAQENKSNFDHTLSLSNRNLLQLAVHYSQHDELNQLFYQGKKAVESEGGSAGGTEAEKARNELFNLIKPGWNAMTQQFDVRQLHYHLGPGSTSFLRVHKPTKYGDNMDNIRHLIVEANKTKELKTGYELGRVYGGLRAAIPIFVTDNETKEKTHVGTLEIGSSLKPIIVQIKDSYKSDYAVLINNEHAQKKVWQKELKQHYKNDQCSQFYIEATTSIDTTMLLQNPELNCDFKSDNISLLKDKERYISTYFYPFRDYQTSKDLSLKPIGLIFIWTDVTDKVKQFHQVVLFNIGFALLALLLLELALFFLFRHDVRLSEMAMYDSLTGLPNRRYFNEQTEQLFAHAKRENVKFAILYMDLDGFKLINDEISHKVGDLVLITISERLKALSRKDEFIARIGGDEFCMTIQDYSNEKEVEMVAERISHQCSQNITVGGMQVSVSISIGIARYPKEASNYEELLALADDDMYQSKLEHKESDKS